MTNNSYTFRHLKEFIESKMRMSHVYQPVMLSTLLQQNGQTTTESIAKAILNYDISQVEYYQAITTNMVGKVLRSHGLVIKENRKPNWSLTGFEDLSQEETDQLVLLCQEKLDDYITDRGMRIWEHRRRGRR